MVDQDESLQANWFRFSVLALDIVPAALRKLVQLSWRLRYRVDWHDDGLEGEAFIHGGTLLPCDSVLPGNFTGKANQTAIHTSEDMTSILEKGDCIRFGGFTTVISSDPKSTTTKTNCPHIIPGKLILRDPLPTELTLKSVGFRSTLRIPKAAQYNGKNIDHHICEKIKTGLLAEMDTTALSFVLIGEKNHALLPRPSRARFPPNLSLERLSSLALTEGEWVSYVCGLRNSAMGHRTSSSMPAIEYKASCAAIKLFLESLHNIYGGYTGLLAEFQTALHTLDFGEIEQLKTGLHQKWQEQFELMTKMNEDGHVETHSKVDAVLRAVTNVQKRKLQENKDTLWAAEDAYRTKLSELGFDHVEISSKLADVSCEMDGPRGIIARLRRALEEQRQELEGTGIGAHTITHAQPLTHPMKAELEERALVHVVIDNCKNLVTFLFFSSIS
jgi:hypothetical protein